MPTLINTGDQTTRAPYHIRDESGKITYTSTTPAFSQQEFRSGTGRRPRPEILDVTPYERFIRQEAFPVGTATREASIYGDRPVSIEPRCDWNSSMRYNAYENPEARMDSNLADDAKVKALMKFNQKDLDLGTAWLERDKTARFIAGVAMTGVDALKAVKRRSGRELLNALSLDHTEARLRGVVDANLAYHYGMKPLLLDVAGLAQALARNPPEQWHVSARGAAARKIQKQSDLMSSNGFPVRARSTGRLSCRAVFSAVQRPLTRGQDLRWALGLDNPLATAWEVTPFSFVADWILPVGDWLSALNSFKYYSGWQGVVSEYYTETVILSGRNGKYAYNIPTSSECSGKLHQRRIVRSLTNVPIAGLPIRDPRSIGHMVNALSLLASRTANGAGEVPILRY